MSSSAVCSNPNPLVRRSPQTLSPTTSPTRLPSSPSPASSTSATPATSRWFLGPPSPSATPAAAASSNPSNQFDVHLGGLLSGGATIQIVLEGSSFPSGFVSFGAGGVSLVDYFMGSGLKQLIQQLAENDPSRYGTLPAAKAAVAALPDVAVDGGRPARPPQGVSFSAMLCSAPSLALGIDTAADTSGRRGGTGDDVDKAAGGRPLAEEREVSL